MNSRMNPKDNSSGNKCKKENKDIEHKIGKHKIIIVMISLINQFNNDKCN